MAHRDTVAVGIAQALVARANCRQSGNAEWYERWDARVKDLVHRYLPSGSGWDNGTKIDLDRSTPERLIFTGSYHHMDEHGSYDGWTDHEVVVTASLAYGLDLRVTGRNRNDVKDYLGDLFREALGRTVEEPKATPDPLKVPVRVEPGPTPTSVWLIPEDSWRPVGGEEAARG